MAMMSSPALCRARFRPTPHPDPSPRGREAQARGTQVPLAHALASLALLVGSALAGTDAHAVVRRCVGPDGGTIYTDRPCDQFNAREQATAPPSLAPDAVVDLDNPGLVRSDCARNADGLLFDLRRAVETADINAIAGLYHWPGVGGRAAVSVMDRLEDVVADPGATVDLVYPDSAFVVDNPSAYPELPVEDPSGIRITRYIDAASARQPELLLGLRRHAGCWWIHF